MPANIASLYEWRTIPPDDHEPTWAHAFRRGRNPGHLPVLPICSAYIINGEDWVPCDEYVRRCPWCEDALAGRER